MLRDERATKLKSKRTFARTACNALLANLEIGSNTLSVIAPEQEDGIHRQSGLGVLLRNNLAVSILIFACLEIWRPYFFLTDDNLTGAYPVFMEMGNHLLSGRSPFVSDYLFGGHYNTLRDLSFFCWHPVYILASLLAKTPFHFAILDVDAFVMMLLATAGFVNLAHYLRREVLLKVTDGWMMFYCVSFSYSMMAVTTGASWYSFLGNQSALPWLALGILQKTWRRGIGLVTLFSIHEILGGHPVSTVSSTLFLTLFAVGVGICRRSLQPLVAWVMGSIAALVILSPLLFPVFEGFLASTRSQGVEVWDMQSNRIPLGLFPTSLFFGMALWIIHPPAHPHVTYLLAIGSCAAAWCLVPAFTGRTPWRGLEIVVLVLMCFGVFMVCRPPWMAHIMAHLPVLKSMRWPFRELLQFQFFFHLFLLLRPPGSTLIFRRRLAIFSTSIFVFPMLLNMLPPTLNAMPWSRELLFSGEFDRYWDHVRLLLKPTDRVAVLIPTKLYLDDDFERPNDLLSSNNFSILAKVLSASGYSSTVPRDQLYLKTKPFFPNGTYEVSQRAALLEERPDLKFITLESLMPLKITLSSKDGPTIDLTPYIPVHPSKSRTLRKTAGSAS